MAAEPKVFYEFGPFRVDPDKQLLLRENQPVPITPKAFDTLLILVRRSREVVSKDELMKTIWPDAFVEEGNLSQNIFALRKALGDTPEDRRYIVTLPGRGYRFAAQVRTVTQQGEDLLIQSRSRSQILVEQTDSAPVEALRAPTAARKVSWKYALPMAALVLLLVTAAVFVRRRHANPLGETHSVSSEEPSVAVVPLQNLSGDPADDYFSDGVSEEISTKLSRIHALRVAPYSLTARLKGTQKSPQDISREFRVGYLLDGTVRKAGNQVRVNARLVDASTGFQVWADDFVGNTKDVFAVQEQAALKIAGALNLKLSPEEERAVGRRYTENPLAYDAYLRARALVNYHDRPEKLDAARRDFEQALQADPDYAPALAGLSRVECEYYRNLDPSPARLVKAQQLAQRAMAIDPQLGEAHEALGTIYGNRYDYTRAAQEFREAIRLEPQDEHAWDSLSWALGYQQPPDAVEAERAARESIRLEPSSVSSYYHLGRALTLQGRYQEAIAAFEQVRQLSPSSQSIDFGLAQVDLAQGDYDRAVKRLSNLHARAAVNLFWLSSAYAARGDKGKALATLQEACAAGYGDFAAIDASPYFASLHSDPRFQQLIRRYRK